MIHAECQQMRELLDSYLSAELLVETNHQILRHIAGCQPCRVELDRRQRLRALMKSALPCEAPPADLVRQIARIPRGPTPAGRAPVRGWVPSWLRRVGRRGGVATTTDTGVETRVIAGGRTRQTLAGTSLATVLIVLLLLVVAPWRPAPVTASELLARSAQAARIEASRTDVVLHRSLKLEERRGRGGTVLTRRRIEVWQNAASGITTRRAFDEHNALVAGEWKERDGRRTIYRPGSRPEQGARPPDLGRLDGDNAWRLDLSATEYASFIPAETAARVEDTSGGFLLRYAPPPAPGGANLVEATITLRQQTLHPIEQTVVVDRNGDIREYSLSESRFDALPREQVAAAVFEPEPVLVGPVFALSPPVAVSAPAPELPAPTVPVAVRPSRDTELDAVYRLHRIDAWLRDLPTVSRTPEGSLQIAARVANEDRRSQVIAALSPVAPLPGVSITVTVDPSHASLPKGPPAPPTDLRSMATYEPLRARFAAFIASRVPAAERPRAEDEVQLVDDLVRSLASRTLERSHEALRRASVLETLVARLSSVPSGDLSPDAEATWQTMLRDHARAIEHRLEALRLELQPVVTVSLPFDSAPVEASGAPLDLSRAATRLATLLIGVDTSIRHAFGPLSESAPPPTLADPALWQAISEAERLAAEFQRPRPLGAGNGEAR